MVRLKIDLNEAQKNKISKAITRIPKNEEEVKRIFYRLEEVLDFNDVRVFNSYPDASAFYNGKKINIEFEKISSNFKRHSHDENLCDLIICWEDDDASLKVNVLELATLVEDWLKARREAIANYYVRPKNIEKRNKKREQIEIHPDKYDFNSEDALTQFMGLSRLSVKYHSSNLCEKPECQGGKLTCEKRDLEQIHLREKSNKGKLVPVVLCQDCINKVKCRIGKDAKIGYYFFVLGDITRPREVRFERIKIEEKNLVEKMKKTKSNFWDAIRFERR